MIQTIADFVWSYPLSILLIATGLFLTIYFKGYQFRKLFTALKLVFTGEKTTEKVKGDISHFQSLMTALAATVGTGNIVGVATAIAIGGPGALFWMWITGLVGMITKFAETLLGVAYRKENEDGEISGGPMYYIQAAFKKKWPSLSYAFFGLLGAIGLGNLIQSNSIAQSLYTSFSIPTIFTAGILILLTGIIILRGIQSIGKITEVVVPLMIGVYFITAVSILIIQWGNLGAVFDLIFTHAFTPIAATGGFIGSGLLLTIRMGIARGLFSNESGMGSAAVVAAAAKTKKPVTQALIAMTQTFIDTIIVCTITGLVILSTGVWSSGLNGVALTTSAFATVYPLSAGIIIAVSLSLFAFSTIIAWAYYGEKFLEYLYPKTKKTPYRIIYSILVGVGALLSLELVWSVADIAVAFMVLPNLAAIIWLLPRIKKEMNA